MKNIIFWAAFSISVTAGAQMVEKSQSTSQEHRVNSSVSGQSSTTINIGGLYFGTIGLIESVGDSVVGYFDGEAKVAYDLYAEDKVKSDLLGAGLLSEWKSVCQNFSRKSYTYSHTPGMAKMMRESRLGGTLAEDAVEMFSLKWHDEIYAGQWAESNFGKPFHHATRFMCIARQAAVIEQALKKLRAVGPMQYEVPSDELLRGSLRYGAETWPQADVVKLLNKMWPNKDTQCNIPTPVGVRAGKTSVYCGALEYDAANRRFIAGGATILDQDTINGKKVLFVYSRESQDSKANSTSKGKKASATVVN